MYPGHTGNYDREIRRGSVRYLLLYLFSWCISFFAQFGSLMVFWKWVAVPVFKLNNFTSMWAAFIAYILMYFLLIYRFKWPSPKLERSFGYNVFRAMRDALMRPIAIIIISSLISVAF